MNSYCETFHVQRINLSYGAIEEFRSARSLPFAGPIVVVGIKNHQHRHWHADLSARTVFNSRFQAFGRSLQFLSRYFNDYSPTDLFFTEKVEYLVSARTAISRTIEQDVKSL